MREALIAYLVAIALNLALLWLEESGSNASPCLSARPALVRVHEGVSVVTAPVSGCEGGRWVALVARERLQLSASDPQESLFPSTARLEHLALPVGALN